MRDPGYPARVRNPGPVPARPEQTTAVDQELKSFNPFNPEALQCPFPHYAKMRAAGPVHHVESIAAYLVTSHELILEVLRDPVTFSSVFPSKFAKAGVALRQEDLDALTAVIAEGYPRVPTLISADPPAHTRYRRLVSKAFSAKAIAELEPVVRAITTKLIDAWADSGEIEFVGEFAVPLPMEVIAKALNVPDDRLGDFKRWSDDTVAGVGANPPLERRLAAERGINELQRYFADALEERRAHPQDDLLTHLLEASIDDDDPEITDKRPLDVPEMLSLIQQLLSGGNETTTKMLAEMMRLLGEHPDQWERLKQGPSLVPRAVEESLRLASIAQGMWRITTRDVELGGVAIPKGSRVVPVYASANRDESIFADPDAFDPARANLTDHVAFGKGTHFCVGAALARLEARVALEELVRRVESFTLSDNNTYEYNPSFLVRGLLALHLDVVLA